jgi:hypothetical protein
MQITALEEYVDFATLDTEKLFNKLKSHELYRKDRPDYDISLSSKALVISAHIGGHDANPINTTVSSALEFGLSSLVALLMSSNRTSPTMRSSRWRESFVPCTSFARRGEDHLGVALSVATPPTSSPNVPRGRSSTPLTNTTTPSGTTIARAMIRSTALGIRIISYRRSCPERVMP